MSMQQQNTNVNEIQQFQSEARPSRPPPQMTEKQKRKMKKKEQDALAAEEERYQLQQRIYTFAQSNQIKLEMKGLKKAIRCFVRNQAYDFGMQVTMTGRGLGCVVTIWRNEIQFENFNADLLLLLPETVDMLVGYTKDMERALAYTCKQRREPRTSKATSPGGFDRNMYIKCGPPPASRQINRKMVREKEALPIFQKREHLLELLRHHQVIIINGETGSGKTTQVPQYILKNANECQTPCKIIVTQPRRLAAVSVATRVAKERGEQIGKTVAYQIRLESTVTSSTRLIYTTSGSFLRTIIQQCCKIFSTITHLIIDEIHERDRDTDFTLITVKEQLSLNPNLRVILMSATMDINLLSHYFGGCPVMTVPGQSYNVKVFTLDDILYHSGYRTDNMERMLESMREAVKEQKRKEMEELTLTLSKTSLSSLKSKDGLDFTHKDCIDWALEQCYNENHVLLVKMGETPIIDSVCEHLDQLLYYIRCENASVNMKHTRTGFTPLIVASMWNLPEYVEKFLEHGADVRICDSRGKKAQHYAELHDEGKCLSLFKQANEMLALQQSYDISSEKWLLLKAYENQYSIPNEIDHDLILSLLESLYRKKQFGAVMVFLPGYTDILTQAELIQQKFPVSTYRIFILHGQMKASDQSEALQVCSERKIILSTNIGQTSITIPDLVYIIDTGKVKMKVYDAYTETSHLQLCWISQADADQRSGRAGRTQNGVCYRLYSIGQYETMFHFGTPEFMRMSLVDICLYAKTLQKHLKVQEFLARALNPPESGSVEKALQKLQVLQIINEDTDQSVTELGKCLVELPLEVQLGKCLLYSIFLRCYSAVLTIVAFHSVKDPYILPADRSAQSQASIQRKRFAKGSFSDHIGILNLYNSYLEVRHVRAKAKAFCDKNFLSQSSLDLFIATRHQIAETVERHFTLGPINDEYKNDMNMVRLALTAGLYPNLACIDRKTKKIFTTCSRDLVVQRNSSIIPPGMTRLKQCLKDLPHDWLLYYEKSRLGKSNYINMNTLISPLMVVLQCGKNFRVHVCPRDAAVSSDESSQDEADDDWSESLLGLLGEINRSEDDTSNNSSSSNTTDDCDYIISLDNWFNFQCAQREANSITLLRKLYAEQFQLFLHQKQLTDKAKLTSEILKMLLNSNCY